MGMNKLKSWSMLFPLIFLSAAAWAQGHAHGGDGAASPGRAKAAGERTWTRLPLLLPAPSGERASVRVRALNLEAQSLDVHAPGPAASAGQRLLPADDGAWRVAPVGNVGNYHWFSARVETPDGVRVASTAHYFSNPGPSPAELLLARKSELEIVPTPLPREHAAYRESEKWNFLVRFGGRALEAKEIVMETEFGSRTRFVTNSVGMATVLLPRDIRAANDDSGGHRPRPGKFVLAVEHEADGKKYLTAFNHTYRKDPDRDSSLDAGVGFLVLGMLGALPLLRRRKTANEDENA